MSTKRESEVLVQKIEYYRTVRPPTLKQFLARQVFKEAAEKTKGAKGTTEDKNRVIPDSAKQMRDNLKGLTAEEIAKRRPDLVEQWEREYGGKRRDDGDG